MARDYRTWIPTRMPAWGQGKWFARYMHAFALYLDGLLQGAVESVKARALHIAPDDALPYAGADSSLPRYPTETLTAYRARLQRRFDDWPAAGTEIGLLGQLTAFGLTAEIKENADWNWDGSAENWSRFWVIVLTPNPWTDDGSWDDPGTWDDGGVWDTNMTVEEVSALRGIPRKFKPADVRCEHVIVVFDVPAWNADQPDGTWGNPVNRNPNAVYLGVADG